MRRKLLLACLFIACPAPFLAAAWVQYSLLCDLNRTSEMLESRINRISSLPNQTERHKAWVEYCEYGKTVCTQMAIRNKVAMWLCLGLAVAVAALAGIYVRCFADLEELGAICTSWFD